MLHAEEASVAFSSPIMVTELELAHARMKLRAVSTWIASLTRRLRKDILHSRTVSLADREACVAFQRLAPSLNAQIAALPALPFDRAAAILSTMDAQSREQLLKGLDMAALGAELATSPRKALSELASFDAQMRASVLEMMPRLAAAAVLRKLSIRLRQETLSKIPPESRAPISALVQRGTKTSS